MALLRPLRVAGTVLVALTILCFFILPAGTVPMAVQAVCAGLAALVLLALIVLTLVKSRRFSGFVQVLLYLSLVLVIAGGFGSQMFSSAVYVPLAEGETVALSGLGMNDYQLTLAPSDQETAAAGGFEIVLTRPDLVSVHETISQTEPLVYYGIEVHPVLSDGGQLVFFVKYDWCRHLIWAGSILFLISLGLSALPAVRRRRNEAC